MSSWDAGLSGIDPERVAELLIDLHGSGPGRRGSGYRVSASAVLTAAHVVRDAVRVRVRFNADRSDEWMTEASVEWSDTTVDAAVVTISPQPQEGGQVAPVGFGRVTEHDAVLACSAMGFPRFKLRNDPAQPLDDGSPSQYRDSVHAVGTIAVLSNRRQGTLEVSVAPPEKDPGPERSPWEGMSGAAVFSMGKVIGLVAEHHRADGLGRLAATRVDRWYERLAAERLDQLRTVVPGLPAKASGLVDVVPPPPGELLEAGYTAQVRDIAPEELLGREEELATLVQFCAGEEPYQWWQAEPWAGKSALAAWFVLYPPAGVTIVSFFVTGRLAGQADSDAFTEAMIEQLAAIAGQSTTAAATPAGRDRERRRLLDQAAARVAEHQGRLVVVVDGLDEDEGAKAGRGKPSIASLLPKRPPDAVRVLVTSRPHPGIPGDVPGDHPLRHCTLRELAPSPHAQYIELHAKRELLEQLQGDQVQVDVIGFITAAGGGLTLRELAELTGQARYLLDSKLGSVFGRSLMARLSSHRSATEGDRVYLFAHETLRTTAEDELADHLDQYRLRIDTWADSYRARGWTESTPRYLLRPYGRLLASRGDLQRLVTFTTDPSRQDRMLIDTQGDAAALAEIATAQQLILARPVPNLALLGRLAVHRDRLANRNRAVPIELPALWVRLGQTQRGEALARSISAPDIQAAALDAVIKAIAETGNWDRAEQLARTVGDPNVEVKALTSVATVLATAGHWKRAEQLAHTLPSRAHVQVLRSVASTMARAGQLDRAERVVHTLPNRASQAGALAAVATALAGVGHWDHAEQFARKVATPSVRARALGAIAARLAGVERDRASALATEAEKLARGLSNRGSRTRAFSVVATALARAGHWDRAEELARSITDPSAQAKALSAVAITLARASHSNRAEQLTRTIPNRVAQAEALRAVATALAKTGQWQRAEELVHTIADPAVRAKGLRAVATALARAGHWDRAEQLAHTISNRTAQADAFRAVATALARAGHLNQAEQRARILPNPEMQADALTAVAAALVGVDQDRAIALATDAEQLARSSTNPGAQVRTLCVVSKALAGVDRHPALSLIADAEELALSITSPGARAGALRMIASTLAAVGDLDRAQQLAGTIIDPAIQARALSAVATGLAEAGQWERAEQLAQTLPNRAAQAGALGAVAKALAEAGHWERAEHLARTITKPTIHDRALAAVATALAEAGHWERAEHLARTITNSEVQARALGTVAQALARAGQWDHAEQLADNLANAVVRVGILTSMAAELADVDENRASTLLREAGALAHGAINPDVKTAAFSTMAGELARTKQWDSAEELINGIDSPTIQARARAAVRASLAASNKSDTTDRNKLARAQRALGIALATSQWLDTAEALSHLDPSAIVAIYEALHTLNARRHTSAPRSSLHTRHATF